VLILQRGTRRQIRTVRYRNCTWLLRTTNIKRLCCCRDVRIWKLIKIRYHTDIRLRATCCVDRQYYYHRRSLTRFSFAARIAVIVIIMRSSQRVREERPPTPPGRWHYLCDGDNVPRAFFFFLMLQHTNWNSQGAPVVLIDIFTPCSTYATADDTRQLYDSIE